MFNVFSFINRRRLLSCAIEAERKTFFSHPNFLFHLVLIFRFVRFCYKDMQGRSLSMLIYDFMFTLNQRRYIGRIKEYVSVFLSLYFFDLIK